VVRVDLQCLPPGHHADLLLVLEGLRLHHALLLRRVAELRGDDDDDYLADTKTRTGQSSTNLQIKLPSTVEDYSEDEDDDDEDDQRPFTRDELQIKTKKGISKRQKNAKKKGPL